jgi:uncharacterized membrane protein
MEMHLFFGMFSNVDVCQSVILFHKNGPLYPSCLSSCHACAKPELMNIALYVVSVSNLLLILMLALLRVQLVQLVSVSFHFVPASFSCSLPFCAPTRIVLFLKTFLLAFHTHKYFQAWTRAGSGLSAAALAH